MRAAVLALLAPLLATAPARAQEGDALVNACFVNTDPEAARVIGSARRLAASGDAASAAVAYLRGAEVIAHIGRSWVVARGTGAAEFVGAAEALRLDLRGAPAGLRSAWLALAGSRGAVALAAVGALPPAERMNAWRRVAARFPATPAAVAALTALGDGHFEAGDPGRAAGAWERAATHLAPDAPVPAGLATRGAAAARAMTPAAPHEGIVGEPRVAWLGVAGGHAAWRIPAVADGRVVVQGVADLAAFDLGEPGATPRPAWNTVDPAAASQAAEAADADAAARSWASEVDRGRAPVLPDPDARGRHAPVRAGGQVVALLGRSAPAAAALADAFGLRAARQGWGMRNREREAGRLWDGRAGPPRLLVAYPLGGGEAATWRLGDDGRLPGIPGTSDFASSPVASGAEVACAVFGHTRELSAHVVAIEAATGRARWATYLGTAARSGMRGPFAGVPRLPPGMGLAVLRGTLVVCTNIGVLAALDPDDGTVLWLRRYPQADVGGNDVPSGLDVPIAAGPDVVAAPWDARGLLRLRQADGALGSTLDVSTWSEARLFGATPAGESLILLGAHPPDEAAPTVVAHGAPTAPERVRLRIAWRAPVSGPFQDGLVAAGGAWLVGPDGLWRVLEGQAPVLAHPFGARRPVTATLARAPGRLLVTTESRLWVFDFRADRK